MNPKLRDLLVPAGIAIVGGVAISLLVARDGIRDADLIDAGADACPDVTLSCLVLATQPGVCLLPDAGPAPAGEICQLELNGKNCAGQDGGVFPFPDILDGGAVLLADPVGTTCVTTANGKLPNGQLKKLASYFCACAPNPVGTCKWNGVTAPWGRTFNSGEWSGACVPKACTSVLIRTDAGQWVDTTWPSNCP